MKDTSMTNSNTTRKRPYRSVRDSSVMENSLINSYITYEGKPLSANKHESKNRRNRKRNSNNVSSSILKEKKVENLVFKKPLTPKRKQIQNHKNVFKKRTKKKVDDLCSSGYESDKVCRRSSCVPEPTPTDGYSKNPIEVIINRNLEQAESSQHIITIYSLRRINITPKLKDDSPMKKMCIQIYLEQTQWDINLSIMTMLIQLIEEVENSELQRYILGMRILESLDLINDEKFELLCNKVEQGISNLSRHFHIDLIKIYIEYVLCMYEVRRK
ncbi:hypothetical protein Trydic_g2895 [Trypoxylus dichotomus]